jgi:hypothetical protein
VPGNRAETEEVPESDPESLASSSAASAGAAQAEEQHGNTEQGLQADVLEDSETNVATETDSAAEPVTILDLPQTQTVEPVTILDIPQTQTVETSALQELQDSSPRGGFLLVSDGLFQMTVLIPMVARRTFTEAEVAKLGSTWKHGDSECTGIPANINSEDVDACGICMESFESGEELATLPCTQRGCCSVWHLGCIHKWLNEGNSPSCPLCRKEIDAGVGSVSSSPATTIAFVGENGNGVGDPTSRLSQDIMGIFFHSLLLRAMASSRETSESRLLAPDGPAQITAVPGPALTEVQM